jgi:hypothetical protein
VFIRGLRKDVDSAGKVMRSRESSHLNVLETEWGTILLHVLQIGGTASQVSLQVARMSLLILPCVCPSVFRPHVTAQGLLNGLPKKFDIQEF